MRILANENFPRPAVELLKLKGHDVLWARTAMAGCGAFSVSQSDPDSVVAYVRNQAEHHRMMTFQKEYRNFLERYHILFDERCMWD